MRAEQRSVGRLERILYLKKAPAISGLPSHELSLMSEFARERSFARGSALLRDGEPVPAIYFVVEGKVRVGRQERDFGVLGPGAGIGSLAIIARDEHGLRAVAEEDTLTLELDADAFLELLEDHFTILHNVLREACRQIIAGWRRAPSVIPVEANRGQSPPAAQDLDFVERILFLRQGAFAASSINALAELSRGLTELRFEPGTTLWSEGEPARSVMLVLSGEAACSSRSRGFSARAGQSRAFSFRASTGVPLGALEAMAEVPRWYEAVALTPLVALSGDIEALFDVFEDNFEMAMDYLAMIARWRIRLLDQLAEMGEDPLDFYGLERPT
jgi:CRP-like cAMP-binding protein